MRLSAVRAATRRALVFGLAGLGMVSAAACSTLDQAQSVTDHTKHDETLGVLIMAHGGSAAWNGEVEALLAPVGRDHPLEIAFGMAEAASLQAAVQRLESRGVNRIAVVRLFVSGESWYERTEQILGLVPGAELRSAGHGAHGGRGGNGDQGNHGAASGHSMALWRIETRASFALSTQGLAEAPEMGDVLVERVRGLSRDPPHESVLIIAHGPEDDAENQRWLTLIDQRAEAVRRAGSFKRVQVETLREDWPEKRAASEARIRAFVEQAGKDNGKVLVIPYRVSGFGPYAEVLKGLDYHADQTGLLPSGEVERWVRRQVQELSAGPFRAQARSVHAQLTGNVVLAAR